MSTHQAIQHTKNWLEHIVIKHNFCPFAQREFEKHSIHYQIMAEDMLSSMQQVSTELQRLEQHPQIETSLLIYPQGLDNFDDFLDYHAIAEQQLVDLHYEGIYQLATFHPNYCFADSTMDDPANYTNRSPYPMLHIIREASLEKALQHYPDPENIPIRNIHHSRVLGRHNLRNLLAQCYTTH